MGTPMLPVPETWDGGEGRELLQMRDFSSEFCYSLYEEYKNKKITHMMCPHRFGSSKSGTVNNLN
jgi:hypothetical protein